MALTLNEAKSLFDRLSQDRRIPWRNLHSSCIGRADAAVGIAITELGIEPASLGRVLLQSPGQFRFLSDYRHAMIHGDLPYRDAGTEGAPGDISNPRCWDTHTAMCVRVKMADENVVTLVIDPALSDKPITPREWAGLQTKDSVVLEASLGFEPTVIIDSNHPAVMEIKQDAEGLALWKETHRRAHNFRGEMKDYTHLDATGQRARLADALSILAQMPAAQNPVTRAPLLCR